jgi:hypothetical protein
MAIDPFTAGIETGGKLLDFVGRFVTDKNAQSQILSAAQHDQAIYAQKLLEKQAAEFQGEIELLKQQIEVNKIEAASPSLFKSGWRPFLGWACSGAFVLVPVWMLLARTFHIAFEFPGELYYTLSAMLTALVGVRSFERYAGVADDAKTAPRAELVKK